MAVVQTLRQAVEQARRVLPPDRAAELERWALAQPKASAKAVTAALPAFIAQQRPGDVVLMCSQLPEYECAVCHRRKLAQPTLVEDVTAPDLLRCPPMLRFVCRCRRSSWTRDSQHVRDAIDAAYKAGRRRVLV
jgi:hypothetical protein